MQSQFNQIHWYVLLGVPVDVASTHIQKILEQHSQFNLLPKLVLQKAEHYLLNDMVKKQYDFFLKNHPNAPKAVGIEQLDAYALLNLSPLALIADIIQALQVHKDTLPLHHWLLLRKWLLHPKLKQRYDQHWQQHFSPQALAQASQAPTDVLSPPPNTGVNSKTWLLGASATALIAALSMPLWRGETVLTQKRVQPLPPVSVKPAVYLNPVSITITAVGDMTLGSHLGNESAGTLPHYWKQYGASYFVQNLKQTFAQDDLTIANLEGPLTQATLAQEKTFAFKGRPEMVDILKQASIEAVSVANNHSHDYGIRGHQDTLNVLSKNGVMAFGYEQYQVLSIKDKRIALIGAKGWDVAQGKAAVNRALAFFKNEDIDYYIMSFHWGEENAYEPNQTQQILGRYAIEQGMDVVLGHHPHVVQGIERYQKGVIVYSLGNFVFGGNRNPTDKDSLAVQLQLDFVGNRLVATDLLPLALRVSDANSEHDYRPVFADENTQKRVVMKMQPSSNVDIRLGQRMEHKINVLDDTPQMAQGQFWCDESLSVRATVFGHSKERFAKCQPRKAPANWG